MITIWDKLDVIYIINLDKDVERYKSICDNLHRLNCPHEKIHRIEAIDGRALDLDELNKNERFKAFSSRCFRYKRELSHVLGEWGCTVSHMKAIEHAYNNNYENVLIFEDDSIINPRLKKDIPIIDIMNRCFDEAPEEAFIYLGGWYINLISKYSELLEVYDEVWLAHSYILKSSKEISYLHNFLQTSMIRIIDAEYAKLSSKKMHMFYASKHKLFSQNIKKFGSNIRKKKGSKKIEEVNETKEIVKNLF